LKTLPSGTVVYDHWLAWELGYYLGDGSYLAYFDCLRRWPMMSACSAVMTIAT
jgi:hypothetical protein